MQKEILLQLLEQNQSDCYSTFKDINEKNADFRLTEQTASVGFIYRHIGEVTNVLCQFFGYKTDVEGTTIGQTDTGHQYECETSHMLFEQGYATLKKLVNETSDADWLEEINTTWFGNVSRAKLLSITLSHNSHHCGQIASALVKGRKYGKS